jgi:hypothetical protein
MEITFKKVLILLAFISFTLGAKAQYSAVPDTLRLSVGLDAATTSGNFGTEYKFGAGVSAQLDLPLTEKFYFTANAGYTNFFASNSSTNPLYIQGVKSANMSVAPVKLGIKYFLIRTFYIQGEAGESFLLNQTALYAHYSADFTYAGQMGILFRRKQKSYIDAGIRYQNTQSFYGDGKFDKIWAARVAYAFNLK